MQVAKECVKDPELMREHVEPAWLQVLDNLHVLEHTRRNEPGLKMWRDFGAMLRVDEETILRYQGASGLVGCSWFKCPLYGVEAVTPLRELMLCSACKKVRISSPLR